MTNKHNPNVRKRRITSTRTLNVVKITRAELREKWGDCAFILPDAELFIRCDRRVNILWDKSPVYTWPEIQQEQKRRVVAFRVPKEVFELNP